MVRTLFGWLCKLVQRPFDDPTAFREFNDLIRDIHNTAFLSQRYHEANTAVRFTTGEHRDRYQMIVTQLKTAMAGTPRDRRRYLRENPDWDVMMAVE